MAGLGGFDANKVEPAKAFDPVPAGEYTAAIIDSSMETNSKGTGEFLKLEFQILDGTHKGRKLYANLNLKNTNEEAVRIARAELSSICRATGILTPNDSVELHNLPMIIKVGMEKRKDTGEMQNRIKAYKPRKKQSASSEPIAAKEGEEAPW